MLALPWAGAQSTVHEEGLVAYYPLDEGSGNVAHDRSSNAGHAKIVGAIWSKAEGRPVLELDGDDDHLLCGDRPGLDLRGPWTLSIWVRPGDVPDAEVGLVGKHFSSYLLTYYKNGQAYAYVGGGGNHVTHAVAPHSWSHLAATFDGKKLRLFVNGQLAAERESKFPRTPPGKALWIGCVVGDPAAPDPNARATGFFEGAIAEVKVYSRALSAHEVLGQYRATAQRRFPPSTRAIYGVDGVVPTNNSVLIRRQGLARFDAQASRG